jgi:hypothetical protein
MDDVVVAGFDERRSAEAYAQQVGERPEYYHTCVERRDNRDYTEAVCVRLLAVKESQVKRLLQIDVT